METIDYTLIGLAIVVFSAWCFNWTIHIIALSYAKWKLHRKLPSNIVIEELPGVSILKPLVGVDQNLFGNLETFFNLKYPQAVTNVLDQTTNTQKTLKRSVHEENGKPLLSSVVQYELLFCIQDEMDASFMIVQSLMKKYPNVDAKVFIGGKPVGVNPKINNMMTGYEAAKHDLILVSDSGLKMGEDALTDMVLNLKENVGLVHQMPYAAQRKGFPSHMEKIFFGTQHAKMYLTANFYGINCATGMSCLMRKNVIEEEGGLQHFAQYLAEDYFLAETFLKKGWKVRVSCQTAQQNSGQYSIPHLHNRLTRWAKLRTAMCPSLIFFEPISQCLVVGTLGSWSMSFLFGWTASVIFLVHILVWFLLDYILIKIVEGGPLPFSKFEFVVGWLLNEVTYLGVIMRSHYDSSIMWRGRRFKLRWGGKVEELHTKQTV